MRLRHILLAVAALALALTLGRDPMTRVVLIVFATGLGMVASALASGPHRVGSFATSAAGRSAAPDSTCVAAVTSALPWAATSRPPADADVEVTPRPPGRPRRGRRRPVGRRRRA